MSYLFIVLNDRRLAIRVPLQQPIRLLAEVNIYQLMSVMESTDIYMYKPHDLLSSSVEQYICCLKKSFKKIPI